MRVNIYDGIQWVICHKSELTAHAIKKKDMWVKYIDLYSGFDIETTRVGDNSYMYKWQMSLMTEVSPCIVVSGRRWEEFTYFIGQIKRVLNLRETTRVPIWIANMSFEFQFMRKHFEWDEIFSKESRQPLFARSGGIEFHEALAISQGNLAYLAKTYCKTQKAVGDLDYSIVRNYETPLTEKENGYCDNDVIPLAEFSQYIFKNHIEKDRFFPLTSTSILRHELKRRAKKEHSGKKEWDAFQEYITSLFPSCKEDYIFIMNYLFRGGFVHGEFSNCLKLLFNYHSFDLKSSYPSQMLKKYYPVTPFEKVEVSSEDELRELCKNNCVIMFITLHDVEATSTHSIESYSKCWDCKNVVLDNGRIRKAGEMTICITELDLQSYDEFYTWDKSRTEIHSVEIAERGALPKYLLDMTYEQFTIKASMDPESQAYEIQKTRVNGMYGLNVTRLNFKDIRYFNEKWHEETVTRTYEDMLKGQVLSPYWGIYITAHARRVILSTMWQMRDYVKYSDTDSHKLPLNAITARVIHDFNKKEKEANKRIADFYGYDFSIIHNLGCLEWETSPKEKGTIDWMIYGGAKRYLCQYRKKGLVATISGLPKQSYNKYCEKNDFQPFRIFNEHLHIPENETGKLRSIYIDEPTQEEVVDNFGNSCIMKEKSSVTLVPVDFSMTIDKDYLSLIHFFYERMVREC